MLIPYPEVSPLLALENPRQKWRILWLSVSVGILSGVISIARIRVANPTALSTLVWAEDGLYPLCAKTHGPLTCLLDPYAGYLSLIPRAIAWPVSWFPLDSWPLVTNVAAAILAGIVAALVVALLRLGTAGVVASASVALLPVLAPIMRIESINAAASIYWPLGFLAILAVCFPPSGRFPTTAYSVGALLTVLTLPTAGVLLLPLVVQVQRGRIPRLSALPVAVALVAGSLIEAMVALNADDRRSISWSLNSLKSWAEILPTAMRIQLPGFADATLDNGFVSMSSWGWVLTVVLLALAVALIFAGRPALNSVGLLTLSGMLMGLFPVLTGGPNNRYFVISALSLIAAGLLALDANLPRYREPLVGLVSALLLVSWWPGFPASEFRSISAPEWPTMLGAAREECAVAPDGVATMLFSPGWPVEEMHLVAPTSNIVPCSVIGPSS